MRRSALVVATALLLFPCRSHAHVKWFCAYDTTIPPLPIGQVLTPTFATVALGFSAVMFIAYLIDRLADDSNHAKLLDSALFRGERYIFGLVRAAVGALFVSLWTPGGLILTPELKTA